MNSRVTKVLEIELANPYHYRRSGVYYLRVRPLGSLTESCTISLRSSNRQTAMRNSNHLQATLRVFHLDRPEAKWPELKARLKAIAEESLNTPTEWELLDGMGLVYSDMKDDLRVISSTASLSVPQAKAVMLGRGVMAATEERLQGDPRALIGLIEEMDREDALPQQTPVMDAKPPMVFEELAGLYLKEHGDNVRERTLQDMRSSCKCISEYLGELDMRAHSRMHLVSLKEALLDGRKPSTVNKLLTRLSTILQWGVNNGYLDRSYDKKLKLTKGTDSTRQAFSVDQVKALMRYTGSLPGTGWERWAISLSVVTGARIGEIRQLTKDDIVELDGVWCVDINSNGGKELKNKYSVRLVPLIDGAYGFDLGAFLGFVQALPPGGRLFDIGYGWFSIKLNELVRDNLNLGENREYSFHSLRHSIASLLKAHGIPVGIAQSIMGHSSQSITFDLYGGNQKMGIGKLVDALKGAFEA